MDFTMKWLQLLHDKSDIVEVRSISPKPVISGYFTANSPALVTELARYPDRTFYQTMNPIESACYARTQHERLVVNPKETTSDNDVNGYRWILVDADPIRPSGVSASKEEKEAAVDVASQIKKRLHSIGFHDPIVADSGNGYHLLYMIHASIDEKQVISDFLAVLDMWFTTERVKIDTAVFNPARITKLYGTTARKGASTPERPHRNSAVLVIPPKLEETSMELVRHVANEFSRSKTLVESQTCSGGKGFDLSQFLSAHHIGIEKAINISSGTKYQLEECPFDSNHKHGDAAVFAYSNGSFGFHCFHNSCSGYHWHEFREKLDPQAYANSSFTIRKAVALPTTNKGAIASSTAVQAHVQPVAPRMLLFGEIPEVDRSKIVVVRSNFSSLDAKIGGFNIGEMSVWSGSNASGKSTLVSQLGLSAVDAGFRVAMFSGEMTAPRVKEWLLLQAAGPNNVEEDKLNPNHFSVKATVRQKIADALSDSIAIYNNDFGTRWEDVVTTIEAWVTEHKSDVVIIDNLMALDMDSGFMDKYEIQTQIVKRFSAMAKRLQVHIHFIAHPRKTDGFLRKGDISGTADITNSADNVFMVHRINADFLMRYKSVYPKLEIPTEAGNAIEIMKNRDMGEVDSLIMLYFDKPSKTMSDVKGMTMQHNWFEKLEQMSLDGFIPIDSPDDFPKEWR